VAKHSYDQIADGLRETHRTTFPGRPRRLVDWAQWRYGVAGWRHPCRWPGLTAAFSIDGQSERLGWKRIL